MQEPINIQDELREIAPTVTSIGKNNPHFVPQNYFEGLAVQLLTKSVTQKTEKGTVPDGYFDQLPNALLNHIRAMEQATEKNELAEIAPILMRISKKMPHYLPIAYFENLEIPTFYEAPIIPLPAKAKSIGLSKTIRWAVAASLVALTGLLTWQIFFREITNPQQVVLTKNNELNTDSIAIKELALALSGLQDESLVDELGDDDKTHETRSALYYYNTNNFENALKELSDAELGQFILDQPNLDNQPS